MAEKTVGMRLKEEVKRIGNCARNSEDVFNVADAVWREIDNRQDRIAKLEQTIDNLCAANEQANTLLGAEIERRELAEARLAALEACGLLVYMKADKVWQSDNCVAATLTEIADGEIKASKIVDAICADIRDADGATHRNDAADATQSDLAKSTGIVE